LKTISTPGITSKENVGLAPTSATYATKTKNRCCTSSSSALSPRLVWESTFADINLNTTWDGILLASCYDNWSKKDRLLTKPPSHGLLVHVARKNFFFFFFENGTPSTSTVAYKTLGLYNIWTTFHPRKETIKTKIKTLILEETPIGWFDGVEKANGMQSGVGGLICISSNTQCRWTFNCGQGTNTRGIIGCLGHSPPGF
jgi:hypothetical protein